MTVVCVDLQGKEVIEHYLKELIAEGICEMPRWVPAESGGQSESSTVPRVLSPQPSAGAGSGLGPPSDSPVEGAALDGERGRGRALNSSERESIVSTETASAKVETQLTARQPLC